MHVLLSAFQSDARAALRLLLSNLEMKVVGESVDWATTQKLAQAIQPALILIDSELIPQEAGNMLKPLRQICPTVSIIVLVNQLNIQHHAALTAEADLLLDKSEMPDQVATRILAAVKLRIH